jgi:hypothetical protein
MLKLSFRYYTRKTEKRLEIIVMAIFQLQPEQLPINQAEWTEEQKMQYRFGGERYSMRGFADRPSHIVKQVNGNYPYPRGEEDVSQIIVKETIDPNNSGFSQTSDFANIQFL